MSYVKNLIILPAEAMTHAERIVAELTQQPDLGAHMREPGAQDATLAAPFCFACNGKGMILAEGESAQPWSKQVYWRLPPPP